MEFNGYSINNNEKQTEKEYVLLTYNKIAKNFSDTRHLVWNYVAKFIQTIPVSSKVLEVGCGNGKNMKLRSDIIFDGCDISPEFVKICESRGLNVIEANNLSLPYADNCYNYTLSVAVIHHLSSFENRLQSIKELVRVTKPNGKIFIEVWAYEQGPESRISFREQDVLVPFKDKITRENLGNRFYHVFKKGELKELVYEIDNITIIEEFYEKGNWGIIIQKN
jgi:SAM-dependent methyltransferase